ncbi:MAG TPA: dihydrodipicolinate synthase family protein [Terriglobia bacterium]|nr:dihydrodipicolinate synthase family protein [Terriglobia bacterium]
MNQKEIVSNIRGIFPPVVTPFNARGDVDEGRFCENLRRFVGTGLSGIVVAGSTGEAPYLTERERLRLTELARGIVRPPEILIVGTGLESTRETIRLSREAVARGADAILVLTPNYFRSRMNSDLLVSHFRAVADSVRRPLVIYNIPQFTGVRMEPSALAALSRHANIAGLKESSGDLKYLKSILRAIKLEGRQAFRVLCGSALIQLEALRAGAVGGVLGQADFMPELCVGLYESFQQGRMKAARDFQQRLIPIAQVISVQYGVSGIKAAADFCGFHGGIPRPPLKPLQASARKIVIGAVREARAGLDQ